MIRPLVGLLALGAAFQLWFGVAVGVAHACGGFFCGAQPVDQTAERIVFSVHEDSTTMVVQIAYSGAAADFAWVLPLGQLPDVDSLDVFPQQALTALDANTGPAFVFPEQCPGLGACITCSGLVADGGPVTVHFETVVGPYEVAGIESDDPEALFTWLQEHQFNVSDAMRPYIETYIREDMKFLVAKLQPGRDVSEIEPLKLELPGTTPAIPLRMTALAAEPEMSLMVLIFGDQRYGGANWPDVEIPSESILWRKQGFWPRTNWTALVARGVDEAGGQGWVTEFAGSTEPLRALLDANTNPLPEVQAASAAVRALIGDASYVTRLYSRLSPEEISDDPLFRRVAGEPVDRRRALAAEVDGLQLCDQPALDPCEFISCGAGGLCRPVMLEGMDVPVAGCACLDGATARTVLDASSPRVNPFGSIVLDATVVCQDARMSFVNPGDQAGSGGVMPDPCASFDCGANGECVAINMTPTCRCDHGFVALGSVADDGTRSTRCEQPMLPVPPELYRLRLPDLPADLPGGRVKVEVDLSLPIVQPMMSDLGSDGVPRGRAPANVPVDTGATGTTDARSESRRIGEPREGCAVAGAGAQRPRGWLARGLLGWIALAWWRRRRR
jgi:hypothetical protein